VRIVRAEVDPTVVPWRPAPLADAGPEAAPEAERRARDLLALARREAERLRAEARARGFEEGREEGLAEGLACGERIAAERARLEHAELAARWDEALADLRRQREDLLAAARGGVLRLALGIAERIAGRALATDPDATARALEDALETLGDCDLVTVEVPLGERARLERSLPPLAAALAATGGLTLVERSDLARGGVTVRAADGRVDASIATRLDRIAAAVLGAGAPPA